MPANPYNDVLDNRRQALRQAYRGSIFPGCDIPTDLTPPDLTPRAERRAMHHLPYAARPATTTVLIPSIIGRKWIYELLMWVTGATTTIQLYQGPASGKNILLNLSNVPANTLFYLPLSGDNSQAHFEIDDGQPFVIFVTAAATVEGFIRYRTDATEAGY